MLLYMSYFVPFSTFIYFIRKKYLQLHGLFRVLIYTYFFQKCFTKGEKKLEHPHNSINVDNRNLLPGQTDPRRNRKR